MKSLCALLLVLLALPAYAGANRYQYRIKDTSPNPTAKIPQFIVADAEVDLPSTDVREGDVAFTKDTNAFWNRTETTWVLVAAAPSGADQVLVSDSATTSTWRTVPDCDNAITSKLLYDQGTNAWSCGTDQTGGGGGGSANVVEAEVDFGATGNTNAAVVVTGQAWVTATSKIVCAPTLLGTADRAEGAEDAIIEGLVASFHTRVVGTGFTVAAAARQGRAFGRYAIHCTGA